MDSGSWKNQVGNMPGFHPLFTRIHDVRIYTSTGYGSGHRSSVHESIRTRVQCEQQNLTSILAWSQNKCPTESDFWYAVLPMVYFQHENHINRRLDSIRRQSVEVVDKCRY